MHTIENSGDFVRVATCATPTEAHLLKGMLESVGLAPEVADANIVQANTWMTQAVGGVRVLVPASQLEAAQKAIAEFNAGAFQLDGDDAAEPAERREQLAPLFSPDRAVLLSFALTPAFGAAVQFANASALGSRQTRAGYLAWLAVLAALSLAGVAFVHELSPGPLVIFRASVLLSFFTVVWYFVAGQAQSKAVIAAYGLRYRQRSLMAPALLTLVAEVLLGWALSEFA